MNRPPRGETESDPRRFQWRAGDLVGPACWTCVHKHANAATCTAFPDGIPEEILDGTDPHTDPYPGDHGILYTPRPGAGRERGW
ncbi:MAG TPA: hypothetical protein VKY74_24005 [Chloroflexia bacterium]|nr:hypothetical protein [Chloroflexia bacterium]